MTEETKNTEIEEAVAKKPAAKKTAPKKPAASAVERAKKAVAKKAAPKRQKKVMTEAQKAAAAKKTEAEKAKAEALKTLTPIATEIRTRIGKADTEEERAKNHRVAAAMRLAEANAICKENKIKFQDWCDEKLNTENFSFGFEMARKLAHAGAKGDEEEVALAIEDMRAKNTASKRKQREVGADNKQIGHNSSGTDTGSTKKPAAKSKIGTAREVVNELDDKAAEELARDVAGEFGYRLVSDADFALLQKIKNMGGMEHFEYAFGKLKDAEKTEALERMADDLGATLEFPE